MIVRAVNRKGSGFEIWELKFPRVDVLSDAESR